MRKSILVLLFALLAPASGAQDRCAELFRAISQPAPPPLIPRVATVALTEASPQARSAFEVTIADAATLRTNDMQAVLRHAIANARELPVYLEISGIPEARREAFRQSLEVARDAMAEPPRVFVVQGMHTLARKTAIRESFTIVDSGTRQSGKYQGYAYERAEMQVDAGRWSVTALSLVAEAAKAFMRRFRTFFRGNASTGDATLDVINRVRGEVARQRNLTEEQLIVELRNEVGRVQYVHLRIKQDDVQ